jgi:2-dehydro-3-deoxyphosphogluconate aldolase / (4S)-4-hydroxy-2-oxoglutarate aldolase
VSRDETLAEIERVGVIAVVRADSPDAMVDVAGALRAGGVTACEITTTVPGAIDAIGAVRKTLGDEVLVGVGTCLDAATAEEAIAAGAEFVVSPILDPEVISTAHRHGKVAIPGALTPTEALAAWNAGADVVKIFPANHFGPRYFRDLHGPLPQLRLTPTGGVDLDSTPQWIQAGAVAVGVGSALVRRDLIEAADWDQLADLAGRYVAAVAAARA